MTKKTKAEKILRQREVLDSLLNETFNKQNLATKWNVLERTIRRDLEEIAQNLGPFDDRLSILQKKALDVLGPRISKMSDNNLIKLISTGVTQKAQVKTEISGGEKPIIIKMWQPDVESTE